MTNKFDKMPADLLHKSFAFETTEVKTVDRDGQKFGIIKGYASTYGNEDRSGDVVVKGAFAKSIERHKQANNRQIRMYYQHDRWELIGGYPIDKVVDDAKGLYVEGEINLEVQKGQEAYALAKQGVLSDLSIGYSEVEVETRNDGVKLLKELELWEISPVSEPANIEANIIDVKNAKKELKDIDIEKFKTIKEIEVFLKEECHLSSQNRKILISKIKSFSRDAETDDINSVERDVQDAIAKQLEEFEISQKLDKLNNLLKKVNKHAK